MPNLENIDITDIFDIPVEERKQLIDMGSSLLLQEIGMMELLQELTFQSALNKTMYNLDKKIEMAKQNENYEICYYLEEVKWNTLKMLKQNV